MLPCLLFEDDHLLVINKPAGINTHAPSPYAGEGIYDWLRHREPRWANLAIIHRLDKETSAVSRLYGSDTGVKRDRKLVLIDVPIEPAYDLIFGHKAVWVRPIIFSSWESKGPVRGYESEGIPALATPRIPRLTCFVEDHMLASLLFKKITSR